MPAELPLRVHASTIALGEHAAIIRGPSGSGKSDLALRCLAFAPNGLFTAEVRLVADDYTELFDDAGQLFARAPANIANLLEVRGLGLIEIEALPQAEAALIVDLVDPKVITRLPDPEARGEIAGIELPRIEVDAFEASAPIKLLLALECMRKNGELPRLPR